MLMRCLLLGLLLAGCAVDAGRWERTALARQEARLRHSPQRLDDPALEAWLSGWLRRIDPVQGAPMRVYVLDLPAPQAELIGGQVLRVRLGLLLALKNEAELAFVLAHELAHGALGHVAQRSRPGWDAQTAEREADRMALEHVVRLGYPPATGAQLLRRLREQLPNEADRALVDARIAVLPRGVAHPVASTDPRFEERLAPYRARR